MRMLMVGSLASDDMEILEARDGDEAWEILQDRAPELALLDVQMPGRTGLELVAGIRKDPRLASMHVILVTAGLIKSDQNSEALAAVDGYLPKPFSPLKLREEVERLLNSQTRSAVV